MDIYRIMNLEFAGIKGEIESYTSEKYIANILNELETSIKNKQTRECIFLLDKVIVWYSQNIPKIMSNQYVINRENHKKYQKTLIDFFDTLREQTENGKYGNGDDEKMKKIFISHSSKDEKICTAFVEVLEQLGVPDADILYSSSDRHGIPARADIFEYLRSHIAERINVFYMLSDNYYESAYCLNEMGASWIAQNEFSIFKLPNFTCGFKGVIDKNKKAYNLKSATDMIHLKKYIETMYEPKISETKWEEVKNNFLKVVGE